MKILKLFMQGFTCYKKETTIDFSDLELFAITGSTGSGKSSIIDAIIFALYGKVPRVTNEVSSLISHNEKFMNVLLEFKTAGITYKVARKIQIKKSSQAILDKWTGDWEDLASGVRQVNQTIVDIIGLDYESFIRCIILPQGAFAKFLIDVKSRQEILTRLLNLEILTEMQQKASKNHDIIKREIEQIELRLGNEFEEATASNLKLLENNYNELEKEINSLVEHHQELQIVCSEQKELMELWENKNFLTNKYKKSLPRLEQIKTLENKIKKAQSIQPFLPILDQLENEKNKLEKAQKYNQMQKGKIDFSRFELSNQEKLIRDKKEKNAQLPIIEKKIRQVQSVQELSKQLKSEQESLCTKNKIFEKEQERAEDLKKSLFKIKEKIKEHIEIDQETKINIFSAEKEVRNWQKFWKMQNYIEVLKVAQKDCIQKEKRKSDSKNYLEEKNNKCLKVAKVFDDSEKEMKKIKEVIYKLESKEDLQEKLNKIDKVVEIDKNLKLQEQEMQNEVSRLNQEKNDCLNIEKTLEILEKECSFLINNLEDKKTKLTLIIDLYETLHPLYEEFLDIERVIEENNKHIDPLKETIKENKKEQNNIEKTTKQNEKKKLLLHDELRIVKEEHVTLHQKNIANVLRIHTKKGDNCPVCDQKVNDALPLEDSNESLLQSLEKKIEKFQEKIIKAEKIITENKAVLLHLKEDEKKKNEILITYIDVQKEKKKKIIVIERKIIKLLQIDNKKDIVINLEKLSLEIKKTDKDKDCLSASVLEKKSLIREQQAILQTIRIREKERSQKIENLNKNISLLENKMTSLLGDDIEIKDQKNIEEKIKKILAKEQELLLLENKFISISIEKNTLEQQIKEYEKILLISKDEYFESYKFWEGKKEILRKDLEINTDDVEKALKEGVEKYQLYCDLLDKMHKKQKDINKELNECRIIESSQLSSLNEITDTLGSKEENLLFIRKQINEMSTRIYAVTEGEEISILIVKLETQQQQIRNEYEKARENYIRLEETIQANEKEFKRQILEMEDIQKQFLALQKEANEYLQKMNISSIEEINQIKIPHHILSTWENEIKNFNVEFREIEAQMNYCDKQLAGRKINPDVLDENIEKLDKIQEILSEKNQKYGAMKSEINVIRKNIGTATEFYKKLEYLHEREIITKELASDLRSNKFPTYVLEEALQTLAEDATIQLDILSSGRYSFSVVKREFHVVDHWHNDQMRTVKTLSGGETFIASLSLALALAERIYQLAHNMGTNCTLESLFLDEGFGTLDEEHLDMVIKALNNLQGTGRTIGIISHLPVLNNYLPSRLVVEKTRESSYVSRVD